jgi:hypothetical protein
LAGLSSWQWLAFFGAAFSWQRLSSSLLAFSWLAAAFSTKLPPDSQLWLYLP